MSDLFSFIGKYWEKEMLIEIGASIIYEASPKINSSFLNKYLFQV